MLLVVVLCWAVLAAEADTCVAYRCDSQGVTWPDNVCAMLDSTNSTQVYIRECRSQQFCPASEVGYGWKSSASCLFPDAPVPVIAAYSGERCNILRTCIQGVCIGGICTLPSICVNVYDCGLGSFCSQGKCLPQVSMGGACTFDTDCVNTAGCDIALYGAAGTGVCIQYSGLNPGATVQNCEGSATSLAPHALCSSGYCFETQTPGQFKCSGLLSGPSSSPIRCPAASSTCISNMDYISWLALEQPCQCGLDGYFYCPLFPADPEYMDYLADVQTFLGSPTLLNCNTARHGQQGSSFRMENYFWCAQNLTTAETYHYFRVAAYPMVLADSCVLKVIMPAYYEVEKEVEPYPTHGLLLLGGVLLGGVLIYLLLH